MNDRIPLDFADSAGVVVDVVASILLVLCVVAWVLDHVNPELIDRIGDRIFGPYNEEQDAGQ